MDSKRYFLVLILLGFVLLPFAQAESVRVMQIEMDGLNYQRHEAVTIKTLFKEEIVPDVDVEIRFQRMEGEIVTEEESEGHYIAQTIKSYKTDKKGELELRLHDAGVYLMEFSVEVDGIPYIANEKINFLIDPGLYLEFEGAAFRVCFEEPIGTVNILDEGKTINKALDEENCVSYLSASEEFIVSTPYSNEYMQIEVPVNIEEARPKPDPTATPEPIPTEEPLPELPEPVEPDYTLIIVVVIVAVVLIGAGFYMRQRRRSL